ncbi:MAG TPA: MBL fold metallo-hydrolase [Candidatus Udaeobacter sp.]|nr:MBL fold metallo-hydrolase [Candidatus Udaeobacter sp.]
MKTKLLLLITVVVLAAGLLILKNFTRQKQTQNSMAGSPITTNPNIKITPISHASVVLDWKTAVVYADPVGAPESYANVPKPDIIVITHEHPDHFSPDTLAKIMQPNTVLIVPSVIAAKLPKTLTHNLIVLKNNDTTSQKNINIQAVPAYNLRSADLDKHPKGNGNGYVLESSGTRVYIAGDTEDVPEMRALKNIDIAFVPMNLPYTMSIEQAADAVLAFKPKQVYPYHYGYNNGHPNELADVAKFKQLVNAADPNIEVVQLNWYPQK